MAYHHEIAGLLPENPHCEGDLPAYLLAQLDETRPQPEQAPLQALAEMTPTTEPTPPELPHDYFLCHPDHEPHRWQPRNQAPSWH